MKTNRVRVQATHAAKPKQARAVAGKPTAETPSTPALRHVFGSDLDDRDLLVSENDPDQFYILDLRTPDAPPRPITRAEAVAWFTNGFVPDELRAHFPQPQPGEPALPALAAEHVTRLREQCRELYNATEMARGFHFLLVSHLEKKSMTTITGIEPSGAEASGIMDLGHRIERELDACHDGLHRLAGELGRGGLARVRLAELDGAELKAEMAATGERMRALRQRLLDGGMDQDAVDELTIDMLNGGVR